MDIVLPILVALLALAAGLALFVLVRGRGAGAGSATLLEQVDRMAQQVRAGQVEMDARLKGLADIQGAAQSAVAERLHQQERLLSKTLEDRLAEISRRLGEGIQKSSVQSLETMGKLEARLAVIDKAQENITQLSNQMVGLQDILSNKQARGAFGEIQLNDLVAQVLPPSAYRFQATLSSGRRADCLLTLPNPPGAIAIDAKFPLESYRSLCAAVDESAKTVAGRAFRAAILTHVKDIAERYILPGETADAALMFLPSEAVYAELHANFLDVVEASYRARVFIVSPTTLWATLNTVRAILKDVRMREQSGLIQREVHLMLADVARLDERAAKLQRHFDQAGEDVRQIRVSTEKVARRADRIEDVQLEPEPDATPALSSPPITAPAEKAS